MRDSAGVKGTSPSRPFKGDRKSGLYRQVVFGTRLNEKHPLEENRKVIFIDRWYLKQVSL